MISVVIPLYNKERQIANTLQTVLRQTFQDFEIVIVNDGSTDNSVAEVEKVQDSRIRIIHQQNAGVSAARNKGIEEAKYDLVAFLDADDEWKPEYLETQYNLFLKYPECSVFAVNYEFRDSNGKITPTKINKLPFTEEDGILSNYFEVASCSHPPICSISIMVKKESIKSIGGFPIGIKSGEDLLTWARLAVNYQIVYSKKSLALYNMFYSPKRLPEKKDFVVRELKLLLSPKVKGIKSYISNWHKNRAYMFMFFGLKIQCINESFLSLRYNINNYKVLFYIILSFFPQKIKLTILNYNKL